MSDPLEVAVKEAIRALQHLEKRRYVNGEPIPDDMRDSFACHIWADLQEALRQREAQGEVCSMCKGEEEIGIETPCPKCCPPAHSEKVERPDENAFVKGFRFHIGGYNVHVCQRVYDKPGWWVCVDGEGELGITWQSDALDKEEAFRIAGAKVTDLIKQNLEKALEADKGRLEACELNPRELPKGPKLLDGAPDCWNCKNERVMPIIPVGDKWAKGWCPTCGTEYQLALFRNALRQSGKGD